MLLTSKNSIFYKNILKRSLQYITKFGIGEGSFLYIYNIINKETKFTYPIILLNQELNPWNGNFHPANLFIIPSDISEIDLFNINNNHDYIVSSSSLIDLKIVRDYIKDKNTDIEFKIVNDIYRFKNFPVLDYTDDRNIGYADKFNNIESLKKLIASKKFNFINDSDLSRIHSENIQNTYSIVKSINKEHSIKIFYSISPFLVESMKFKRSIYVSDNDVTSTIYLIQGIKSLEIHSFYRYVDIDYWELVTKSKKG